MKKYTTLNVADVYKSRRTTMQQHDVKVTDGDDEKTHKYDVCVTKDAVAIIASIGDKFLMLENFRYPVGKMLYELPAGQIEPGQTPMDAAIRELEEETGYLAGGMKLIAEFYTSPGLSTEKIYLYTASDLKKTSQNLGDMEDLRVLQLNPEEIYKLVRTGQIQDAKTLLAVYWFSSVMGDING